jgi:hypothetical protein
MISPEKPVSIHRVVARGHGFAIMPWRIKPWQSSLGLASISNCKKAAPPARLFVALRLFIPAITRAAE